MNQTDFGKLRANPNAGDNMVRVVDCDTPGTVCQDTDAYTLVTGDYLTGFVYTVSGTTYTVTLPASILLSTDNLDEMHDALLSTIGTYEVDPYISVTESSGIYTFTHIGAGTLSSVTVTSGSQALTRTCTTTEVCDFIGIDVGTITLGDGTDTNAMDNNPHAWTGTPATDAATAAALKTDIETELTALSITGTTVTVDVNDIAEAYTITITAGISNDLYLTGTKMTKQNCRTLFS